MFCFWSSSSASTTFFHLPAPRFVMPDRGSKGVGWVVYLAEASWLVLGWICEGLCWTMLQVVIDSPLQVVYIFYKSSTSPLSPLPTGSTLILQWANRGGHLGHRLPRHRFCGTLPLVSLPCSKVVSKCHVVVRLRSCFVLFTAPFSRSSSKVGDSRWHYYCSFLLLLQVQDS
jgi:hypothetical protein